MLLSKRLKSQFYHIAQYKALKLIKRYKFLLVCYLRVNISKWRSFPTFWMLFIVTAAWISHKCSLPKVML